MRLLVVLAVLTVACGRLPQSTVTPVTQTPTVDSTTHTLRWSHEVLDKIFTLTAGLKNEIGLCGLGHTSNDTAYVDDVMFPGSYSSTSTSVAPVACPEGTIVGWHPHLWDADTLSLGFKHPSEMCQLSWPDVSSAYRWGFLWVAVSTVARDTMWMCWWSKEQVTEGYHRIGQLKRVPHQGIIGDRRLEAVKQEEQTQP